MSLYSHKLLILVLLAASLFGCAGERLRDEGLDLMSAGRYEEGLAKLGEALAEAPTSADFRKNLLAQRAVALEKLGTAAIQARQVGRATEAETLFKRMLGLEPGNARAQAGLEALARDRRHAEAMTLGREAMKAGDTDQAQRLTRTVLLENPEHADALALRRELAEQEAKKQASEPTLKSTYTKPINLEIRDANVKMIFESLARSTGINFILDKDVRPDLRTTVFLRNAAIEDAIDLIVQTSQLKRKVLNSNTVLVYPNTVEKAKDYQELVMKGFYLQNGDVKLVQTSLKSLLKTKDIVIDEKLNLIVVRDTPEAIRLAEKLIAMHDLSEPEVMLEVEVLEVQRSRLLNLGIQWPNQLTLTPLSGGGTLTLDSLKEVNSSRLGAAISPITLNLRRDLSDANILANPRIRARNREKAKIMIGDKLPVVTTTTTATGLVSDSIQYLDVGIKLDVEPDVRLKDEVVIKVGLEVSSIAKEVRTPSGSLAYQVGTRNAATVLRLKDGETQILGGLISDQERSSAARVPLFGDIPVLGRLFGSQQDDKSKSEIVLSITPRLIRNLALPDASNGEFWSGTEAYLRTKPLALQNSVAPDSAKASAAGASAPAGGLLSALRAEPQSAAKSASLAWQGPTQVKAGEEFKLILRLKSDGALRGLPLQLGFDAKAVQVVDVVEGGFFRQNGGATSFSKTVDAAAGKVFVSVSRSESDGAQGDDAALTLVLRALPGAPTGELRVLLASPIIHGDKPPSIALPAPHAVTIVP
ncbi:MAG: general secretion pathway protein GspD [Rhodocyclales bacterium RIFCSPLOWO2_02_FULL_63_24]|nr:MAG: general secretion pathway protein GspD [Rhodocyclales bacterium RIFCSPLOWO2_02_FULL_63_24]